MRSTDSEKFNGTKSNQKCLIPYNNTNN